VPSAPNAAVAKLLEEAAESIKQNSAKDAVEHGKAALTTARNAGDKESEAAALTLLMAAYLVKHDVDEALRMARELAKIARNSGDIQRQVRSVIQVSDVLLASSEPGQAIATAEEAIAIARASKDNSCLAAALAQLSKVHRTLGKPISALKAAREAVDVTKGKTRDSAAAHMLAAEASPASQESLAAGKEAVNIFQELGDSVCEAAALIAVAYAHGSQPVSQFDDGLRAAFLAIRKFKESGDRAGEALAVSTASRASALKEDTQEAARMAKDAQRIYQEVGLKLGVQYASDLYTDAPFANTQQTGARLLFDENHLAHIEVSETATQESLESIVSTLHNYNSRDRGKYVQALVIHVGGTPVPSRLHAYAMSTGTFLIGIRSVGLPVVSCCWGTIAGPSWGLLLLGDYRVVAADATFVTPITKPIECLADMLGPSTATHLTMDSGTLDATSCLEMGIFHQVQKDRDHAEKSATEQAKRICSFPVLASRQTLSVMTPNSERFIFVQ